MKKPMKKPKRDQEKLLDILYRSKDMDKMRDDHGEQVIGTRKKNAEDRSVSQKHHKKRDAS